MKDRIVLDLIEDFMTNECGEDELESMTRDEALKALVHVSKLLDGRSKP